MQRLFQHAKVRDESRAPLSKFGLYGLVTVLIALIAVGSYIGAAAAGKQGGIEGAKAAQAVAALQLQRGCGRTQVTRGYLKLRSHEVESLTAQNADTLFRIVWCERTYAPGYDGKAIYLRDGDERCFLALLRAGYWNEREPYTDPVRLQRVCSLTG